MFALTTHDFQSLLERACTLAADGLRTPFSKALRYLPDEKAFVLAAGTGWQSGLVGQARIDADLESPAGFAYRTGQPVISNRLEHEKRFRTPAIMAEHGIHRTLNVIVRGEGEPYGVLEVDSRDPGDFTERDTNFLQSLATTLGVALDRETAYCDREELLRQKDLLIREIDHRVKNSLAITQSLLAIQAREVDEACRGHLQEAGQRVATIALVHDRLYRSSVIGIVGAQEYLGGLCEDLSSSLGLDGTVRSLRCKIHAQELKTDQVVSLGLIMTELVTNAAKYGRDDVQIVFEAVPGGGHRLVVSDGGTLPENFDPARNQGLGMRIVSGIVRQLGGSLHVEKSPSTRFVVDLPAPLEP